MYCAMWSSVVWGEPTAAGNRDAEWNQSEDKVSDRTAPCRFFSQSRPSWHGVERCRWRCCQRRHRQLQGNVVVVYFDEPYVVNHWTPTLSAKSSHSGWPQTWKTWNSLGISLNMEFSGNCVQPQGKRTLRSGCSLCQAIHIHPSVSGAQKLLIWAIWDDRLLLVTWVVVDVEWPLIYEGHYYVDFLSTFIRHRGRTQIKSISSWKV